MQTLTLTYVGRFTTNKAGEPLVSKKTGKPYTSLRIKANEYGDKYLSGFDGAETASWKEGDTVEAEVEQKGEYLNFSVPRIQKFGADVARMTELGNKVTTLTLRFNKLMGVLVEKNVLEMPKEKVAGTNVDYPESHEGPVPFADDDFKPEDIPFD